ncbi:hypothetical protein [Magnetococcus sp. PR-3]|uniref:hypothetical protein n=1 Tax=Magnetococcus sp. PR-3 TaxID=3120355 RepID=UPI002FCE1C91
MKYDIKQNGASLAIDIQTDASEEKAALLQQFQACQSGQCTCPSDAYNQLDKMDVQQVNGHIKIEMTAKEGMQLKAGEVARCIAFTGKTIK